MSAAAFDRYTPEEYLALDRNAEFRSEYIDGRLVAMSGNSRPHSVTVSNLVRMFGNCFDGRPCEVYSNTMRVKVTPSRYVYPDVVAVCDEPKFEDREVDILLNPGLVVEVLSPSTASYDRGDKFVHYRKIDSLLEVLFIAQDCVFIEHWRRQGDMWTLTEITGVDDTLMLNSVGCAIPVQEIYSRLDVSEGPGNS
ncbi:Uma2 family endonuclease [Longimicrobium sp.]|jgi:Uma2 family endonuclease|uniref:Uma2 family endonuclease n=1 Tax=Longimicrobium sp. TaxID=2029185 RepID=UPI002F940DF0